jgi:hypothetical protein
MIGVRWKVKEGEGMTYRTSKGFAILAVHIICGTLGLNHHNFLCIACLGCRTGNPWVIPGLPHPYPPNTPTCAHGCGYSQVWVWVPTGSKGTVGWAKKPVQTVGWLCKFKCVRVSNCPRLGWAREHAVGTA